MRDILNASQSYHKDFLKEHADISPTEVRQTAESPSFKTLDGVDEPPKSRPQVNDASTDESSQQFVTRAQVYDTDTDAVTVTDESRQQFRTQ